MPTKTGTDDTCVISVMCAELGIFFPTGRLRHPCTLPSSSPPAKKQFRNLGSPEFAPGDARQCSRLFRRRVYLLGLTATLAHCRQSANGQRARRMPARAATIVSEPAAYIWCYSDKIITNLNKQTNKFEHASHRMVDWRLRHCWWGCIHLLRGEPSIRFINA